MNQKIVFKPVAENDFEEILRLEQESFNAYDRLDRETLVELFSEFSEGFYSINLNAIMIGYLVFLIENGAGYVESIAIDNKYRRQGFGQRALEFVIKRIAEMKIKDINLHVRVDNHAAISLYEKEGFVKKGIVEGFYTDGGPAYLFTKFSDFK